MVTKLSETTGKLSNKVRECVTTIGKNDTTIALAKDYIRWYNTPGFPGSNSDKDKEGRAIWSRCDALLAANNAANASVGGTDEQPTPVVTGVSKSELIAYTTGIAIRTGSIAAGKAISKAAKTTGKVLNAFVKGLTCK